MSNYDDNSDDDYHSDDNYNDIDSTNTHTAVLTTIVPVWMASQQSTIKHLEIAGVVFLQVTWSSW